MKILLLTTYFEPDSGAAAVRLSRLARMLRDRGHEITVLTTLPHYPLGRIDPAYRGRFSGVEERDGIRVVRTWLWATPSPKISRKLISQNSFMLSSLLRGLLLPRPDVMLIEAQPIFTSFSGYALSLLRRRPYVLNVSDLWPDHLLSVNALKEDSPVYRTARHLVDMTFRRASAIVAMSPAWAQKIQAYIGPTDKVETVFNGVDLNRFRPDVDATAFRQKYGLTAPHIVSFIGTFATQYDFDLMFEVARRFQQRDDLCFVFIGGGSQAEKVASMQLPNLRQIPWIDHEEIPAAWAVSDLTYWAMRDAELYRGTVPAKLFECFACGVPVAAAMGGVAAEMIDQAGAGVVVPSGDADGLEKAISRLMDSALERQQAALAARHYAEAYFDPTRVTDAYERLLIATASR